MIEIVIDDFTDNVRWAGFPSLRRPIDGTTDQTSRHRSIAAKSCSYCSSAY